MNWSEIHNWIWSRVETSYWLFFLSLLLAEPEAGRKGKKPSSLVNEGPSLVEMSGYNTKRQEFDPEYDNDSEQLLADMEFKDTDTEDERELKLKVLRIYSKRYLVTKS